MASRKRSRSVRERSSSTLGAAPGARRAGRGRQRPLECDVLAVGQRDRLDVAGIQKGRERRAIGLRQGRRSDVSFNRKCDVALGRAFELQRQGVVEPEPHDERAHDLRAIPPDRDRYRHHLQDAVCVRPEPARLMPGECLLNFGQRPHPTLGDIEIAQFRQHSAVLVGQHHERRIELLLIAARQRLHGRRIACVDGGFQARVVRHEASHHRERPDERRTLLVHERAGLEEPALQFCLGLARRCAAHEVDGGANRQHGQRGAGQENAVGERSKNRHAVIAD